MSPWWQNPYFMASFGATIAIGFVIMAAVFIWLKQRMIRKTDDDHYTCLQRHSREEGDRHMMYHRIRNLEQEVYMIKDSCRCTTCVAEMEADPGKPDKVTAVRKLRFKKKDGGEDGEG
jgi:hypothetical protein